MVEDAQEQDPVEPFFERGDIVDGHAAEFDRGSADFGGEFRLGEIPRVRIDAKHASRAAAFHFDRIETGVAADIEHACAFEIGRNRVGEARPLDVRIIAQEVRGRGADAGEVEIMKPLAEFPDAVTDLVLSH